MKPLNNARTYQGPAPAHEGAPRPGATFTLLKYHARELSAAVNMLMNDEEPVAVARYLATGNAVAQDNWHALE